MLPNSFWDTVMTESNGFYSRWNPDSSLEEKAHCKYYPLMSFG
jgi:hypothetical protein